MSADPSTAPPPPPPPREWVLNPESEYRFELDPDTTLAIKVRQGGALRDPAPKMTS